MTTTARGATSSGSADTSGGWFTRLNPADGLFLRAEHLMQIEDYAAGLSHAVGRAAGAGVVYGFKCTLSADGTKVQATGGFAIAPSGQPLRSKSTIEVPIDKLAPDPG